MTEAPTVPPLVVEFDVAAGTEHAFATWVERADLWWPPGHTMSGAPVAIVFEPRVGGRIYERDAQGAELQWGEVLVWDPPTRVECLWYLFFTRAEATRVAVTFTPSAGGTTVRLVQTGWDALGEPGPIRRERTVHGWAAVTAEYRRHVDRVIET
ncbi:MAG: Activator of Hsp90 ATPase 1 family protein [Actinomycetia bacterium]|nr:Activator of Hsp90 ATPase 1 family protein [Actinomycetes bacterium]